MSKLYEKNELTFSLAWIIAYVVLFSVADNLSESLGFEKIITAPAGICLALFLFIWIRNHNLSEKYGLCSFKGNYKDYLYFAPLLLIMTTNLWNGVAMNTSITEAILHILSMLCVGFIEEVIFRGLLFKAICKTNVKQAILISSITFGIGHIVNLLNGADILPTLLQICYATAIGFLFTTIFYKGKSLLPCIATHGIVNSLTIFAIQGSQTFNIATAMALCVISASYALWIWKKAENPEKNTKSGAY
ncbi:type II CAAX endopeptidase family protein [Roseburia hominis]